MALDKAGLISDLTTIFSQENDPATAATDIANAIDTYVKTATVNVTQVTGVTPGGGTSGPGTGTLS